MVSTALRSFASSSAAGVVCCVFVVEGQTQWNAAESVQSSEVPVPQSMLVPHVDGICTSTVIAVIGSDKRVIIWCTRLVPTGMPTTLLLVYSAKT